MMDIQLWARRYGEQIRQLEDHELFEDRKKVRIAWGGFLRQLVGENRNLAVRSYNDAYSDDGIV